MTHRIMVADDDPAIVDALQLMLELDGYEVKTTSDGSKLLDIQQDSPDLLLLDIWMSGQDGRELCRYLKSNPLTRHIPVIMISASRDIEKSADLAGADDYIAKPFEIDELLAKVKLHLT